MILPHSNWLPNWKKRSVFHWTWCRWTLQQPSPGLSKSEPASSCDRRSTESRNRGRVRLRVGSDAGRAGSGDRHPGGVPEPRCCSPGRALTTPPSSPAATPGALSAMPEEARPGWRLRCPSAVATVGKRSAALAPNLWKDALDLFFLLVSPMVRERGVKNRQPPETNGPNRVKLQTRAPPCGRRPVGLNNKNHAMVRPRADPAHARG